MGRARSRHFKLHEEHALNHRPLGVEALGIQGAADGLNPIVNDDDIRKEARTDYVCAPSCTLHLQAVRQKTRVVYIGREQDILHYIHRLSSSLVQPKRRPKILVDINFMNHQDSTYKSFLSSRTNSKTIDFSEVA